MKKILPLFSYIFHPIFTPIFGTVLYFYLDQVVYESLFRYYIFLQVAIITFFIPITIFYLFKTLGAIDSIMVSKISQRKILLFIQIVLLFILIQKSITIDRIPELYYFFLGGLISTVLTFILLFFKVKASIHMIGIGSLTVFAIGLSIYFQNNSLYLISFLTILNGIIATSRIEMNAHSIRELFYGTCIGVIPQIALLWFWL